MGLSVHSVKRPLDIEMVDVLWPEVGPDPVVPESHTAGLPVEWTVWQGGQQSVNSPP